MLPHINSGSPRVRRQELARLPTRPTQASPQDAVSAGAASLYGKSLYNESQHPGCALLEAGSGSGIGRLRLSGGP